MLHHNNTASAPPRRTIILGAGGFIGGAILRKLGGASERVLGLGRKELDLLDDEAGAKLAKLLRADDALVMVSARAPCKTPAMMLENIRMMAAVCEALAKRPVAHLVYVSSDAVYADGPLPLTERSPAAPTSLHGAMHLAREQMMPGGSGRDAARGPAADAGLWRRRSAQRLRTEQIPPPGQSRRGHRTVRRRRGAPRSRRCRRYRRDRPPRARSPLGGRA